MPRPLPNSYLRGTSPRATAIFDILNQQWSAEFEATSSPIDISLRGPGAIWRTIIAEYPGLAMAERRQLTSEVMTLLFDHVDFISAEAGGHA